MAQSPTSRPIRILIVDDHQTLRRGLRSLLLPHSDMEVVGEAGDGAAAVSAATELAPDVVLLDIKLVEGDGIDTASQLASRVPNSKIIILTAYDSDDYILRAFQAGAQAYLLKSGVDETIVETIRQVYQGRYLLSDALIDPLLRQFRNLAQQQSNVMTDLSEEERRVLRKIAEGATNEEIAKEMYWSARTTKRRVEEIIAKMGARNRAQAAAEAVRKDLI